MDSINISWEDEGFAAQVISNVRELGHPITFRDRHGKRRHPFRGYQTNVSTLIDDKRLYVGYDPYGKGRPALMMSLHCSHFTSMAQMMDWLGKITEGDFDTVLKGEIRRLDCCVDLALPYETIRETVEQPRVTTISEWKSSTRTLYLGTHPRQTRIYEKRVPLLAIDNLLDNQPIPDRNGNIFAVRVEVSLTGNRVPIKTFGDFEQLEKINPFQHLTFKEVDEAIVDLLSVRKRYPIDAYQFRSMLVGAAMAKREINEGGNFARNVGRYLKPLDIDLEGCWKRRANRFLRGIQVASMEGVVNESAQ